MKVGIITNPNDKGQIVIPKEIREKLGITSGTPLNLIARGGGLYIYPIEEVITTIDRENSYPEILQKTRGSWRDGADKIRKRRREIELEASRKRKQAW